MKTPLLFALASVLLLAGCGVEGLGTAATAAKLQAEQAKKAQQDMDALKSQLDTATKAAEENVRRMEEATKE